jgi:hypothetical protein
LPTMAISDDRKRAIDELIDALCALQPTTGRKNRKLADLFLELPPRDAYPDYYLVSNVFGNRNASLTSVVGYS